jgi:uncharacterized membrane protein
MRMSGKRAGEKGAERGSSLDLRIAAEPDQIRQLAQQLRESGFDQFSERERRLLTQIATRRHVTRNVNHELQQEQTFGDRWADRVAGFGGSWTFIALFLGSLLAWVVLNTVVLARSNEAFDPYPYIFLNLILSVIAAVQAPVILMSQNRQAARDRIAAGLDYEINLKAEIEIMALHEKLDRILIDNLEQIARAQQEQLQRLTELCAARAADRCQKDWPWQKTSTASVVAGLEDLVVDPFDLVEIQRAPISDFMRVRA